VLNKSSREAILHHLDVLPKNQQNTDLTVRVGGQQHEANFGEISGKPAASVNSATTLLFVMQPKNEFSRQFAAPLSGAT